MNYSELLDNVRNYTEVGSEVLSNSVINVFITNTEDKIQKQLDLDAFRKFATSSLTVGSPFLTVPEDFDFERGVQVVDGNSDRTWLEQRDTTFIDEYNLDRENNTGTPRYYANWDENTFILALACFSVVLKGINARTFLKLFFNEYGPIHYDCDYYAHEQYLTHVILHAL